MAEPKTNAARRPRRDVHGVLLLDKPAGLSSNQALQRVRWLLGARKGGHGGSLDPLATGMLPLCFGDATRFSHALLDAAKTYEVVAALGAHTTTGDAEGDVIRQSAVPTLSVAAWQALADRFVGVIEQVPPMYSALKHEGRRLYELARRGETVERPPRRVTIHALAIDDVSDDRLRFTVRCSKGTYVRTLVEDLANAAGTLGWTRRLHRVGVEPYNGPMHTLAAVEAHLAADADGAGLLLAADSALAAWPECVLDAGDSARFCHGQALVTRTEKAQRELRCYGPGRLFLGTASVDEDGILRPRRVMSAAVAAMRHGNSGENP